MTAGPKHPDIGFVAVQLTDGYFNAKLVGQRSTDLDEVRKQAERAIAANPGWPVAIMECRELLEADDGSTASADNPE